LREQREKQRDWLATNTDVITNQSQSPFACSHEKHRPVENGFKTHEHEARFILTLNLMASHFTPFHSTLTQGYYHSPFLPSPKAHPDQLTTVHTFPCHSERYKCFQSRGKSKRKILGKAEVRHP
jgi:hypothetical protein